MAEKHIATYLNDHLAGAMAAVELLEHMESAHSDSPLGETAGGLRAEIEADRQELKAVMGRLEIGESRSRKASGWLGSKVTELKLRLDDRVGGDLHLLEALEVLSLGIEGKHSLWRALKAVAEEAPALRVADYDHLAHRAADQRARVEALRLDAARKAFGSNS